MAYVGIEGEGEGVFDVELEVVDLELGEAVGETEEGLELGDPASGDVEGESADGQVGRVVDGEAGGGGFAVACDLAERLECVEQSCVVGGVDGEVVGFGDDGVGVVGLMIRDGGVEG